MRKNKYKTTQLWLLPVLLKKPPLGREDTNYLKLPKSKNGTERQVTNGDGDCSSWIIPHKTGTSYL